MDNYPIQVLMLAKNEKVLLSTGECELIEENFEYNDKAGNSYPKFLSFNVENEHKITLRVQEIIDADNLLYEFSPIIRFIVKNFLKLRPGYFRLNSKFELNIKFDGKSELENGNTLHEMVITK